ncbi:hypothetical protein DFJ58DRAFT_913242 [Suillus subalutaceus]|uniref:uncharacterized protein n=1 Tax=Suillus subalutaceus TaxID=48586 RepID=UPI001B87DA95|nr:uncharacterized protein DFJ58DRAFT_913242 [Suillus subalutaceus]KAG1859021.1 hypothetical protein DFJ58DRAFT_913242 [Suillus subalutaceus]
MGHFSVLAAMGVAEIDDAATVRTIAREKRIVSGVASRGERGYGRACQNEHVMTAISPSGSSDIEVLGWGWNEHKNLWLDHTDDVPKPIKICGSLGTTGTLVSGGRSSWRRFVCGCGTAAADAVTLRGPDGPDHNFSPIIDDSGWAAGSGVHELSWVLRHVVNESKVVLKRP